MESYDPRDLEKIYKIREQLLITYKQMKNRKKELVHI